MGRSSLVVIIPAFNESQKIESVIDGIPNEFDVMVIDDNSTDNTSILSQQKGAEVFSFKENKGYEKALEFGFKIAIDRGYIYAIQIDADGQHPVDRIVDFYSCMKAGFDFAVGDRTNKNRIMEKISSLLFKNLFRLNDPLCGMKCFKLSCFKDGYPMFGNKMFGIDIIYSLIVKKYSFENIKINVVDREDDSRFGSDIKVNTLIFKSLLLTFIRK
jgi:glycosyltransferase involved in cell wall biosynthesis